MTMNSNTILLGIWVWVSVLLISGMWINKKGSFVKKLLWTAALCIPLGGWLLYGAIYDSLTKSSFEAKGKEETGNLNPES